MADKRISELPYLGNSGYTAIDIIPIVGYVASITGETYNTPIEQFKQYINSGLTDYYVTGGTYSNGILTLLKTNGDVIITGFTDYYVNDFIYQDNSLTIVDNSGNTFTAIINTMTGLTVNGVLSATTIDASVLNLNGLSITGDTYLTGGTFDINTGTLTLYDNNGGYVDVSGFTDYYVNNFTYQDNTFTITDNSGNTFSATIDVVTGLTVNGLLSATTIDASVLNLNGVSITGDTYITGGTFDNNTDTLTLYDNNGGYVDVTGFTDWYTTDFTYQDNTLTISDNSGNTFSVSIDVMTGLTVNGILSATTINTESLNLNGVSITGDTYITGGTFDTNTDTLTLYNNNGGYVEVTGFTDWYTTNFTYQDNTFTITDNSGNTFSATIDVVTGLTVNGILSATTINVDFLNLNTGLTGLTIDGDLNVIGNTYLTGETNYYSTVSGTNPNEIINLDYLTGYVQTNDVYVTGSTLTSANDNTNSQSSELSYHGTPLNGPYTIDTENTFTTGGTYDNNTTLITFNRNDGTSFTVDLSTIDVNDTYITGYTYQDNTFTIFDNSGNTFSTTIDSVTGLTVNGNLKVTGDTILDNLTATTLNDVNYIDFNLTPSVTAQEGRLFWDTNNRTLSIGMIGGPIQQIGEEQYYLVENQTGSALNDGTVVRATGSSGSSARLTVDYMIADGSIPAFTTLGVLTQTLNPGDVGYVTNFGLVRNIDTTGTLYGETWGDGTILYVSETTLGGFTSIKPITPNLDIIIAIVMEAGVNGSLFVRPDIYRPFKDPNRIVVAKQNGDFTSIKDAVDSINSSTSSNRYVIDVGPGEYYEDEIDLTSKPYVSIVGSNIQTTLIIPNSNTQHIVKIGANNEISFLSFSGASTGYAGIYCYDIGDFGQAHKCSFYDCDINVWVESVTIDTKFYGEYLDFNGTYTYGTKVIGNNGYVALANLENYFNFPTGSNITYCNYATGSGATLSVFVADCQSNGVSGSTAYLAQDGAGLFCSTITIDGFTYGIHNPNIGDPIRFDIDGASIVDTEWDLYVERSTTFGTFGGSSNHEKIFTNSPDVYWAFLDTNDGEFDITRKASVTFTDGSHTDFTTLTFKGGTMGVMSGGSITIVSGLTINTETGFGYLEKSDNSGIVRRIDWFDTQLTLTPNSNLYIFINENGILNSSGIRPSSINNIILGRVVTNSLAVEFVDLSPVDADHMANRYGNLLRNAIGPIYSTGSIVTENVTPFNLDVTMGEYYYASNEYMPLGGNAITFTQYYRDGLGGWVTSATTTVDNTSYDGNGVLSALTAGYFTKHTLYVVGEGSYEEYFLVLGQNEYPTLVQTEDALLPTPPNFFSDSVTQIANIYIQQGTTGITQVEDIRPVIGFKAGGVNASSVHGNLLGLSADDHLQYLRVDGARAMSGNLNMGGNEITNVGNVDGVDVSSHAVRHQFGGLDPVGTTTPTPNAIPYANVSGLLDDWVSTASTTTLGKVKISTTPLSASSPIAVGTNDLLVTKAITGGTFNTNTDTLTLTRNDGTQDLITGITDWYTTGFTYQDNTFTITDNSGSTFSVIVNTMTGLTVNGILSANTINVTTLNVDGINVTGDTFVTDGTFDTNTDTLTLNRNNFGPVIVTGITDWYTTGFTYSNNTFSISDNSGTTLNATINNMTGLTVNGLLSATTLNVNGINVTGDTFVTDGTFNNNTRTLTLNRNNFGPVTVTGIADIYPTGFTYSNNTFTISNNSGNTLSTTINSVTGLTVNGILSATTISATTLNVNGISVTGDTFVTSGTLDRGTGVATFNYNRGGSFTVTGFTNQNDGGFFQINNYTSGVPVTITHNFNTLNVLVQIVDLNTNEQIYGTVTNYQLNSVQVTLDATLTNIKVIVVCGNASVKRSYHLISTGWVSLPVQQGTATVTANDRLYTNVAGNTTTTTFYKEFVIPPDFVSFVTNGFKLATRRSALGTGFFVNASFGKNGVADATINALSLVATNSAVWETKTATPTSSYSPGDRILISLAIRTGNNGNSFIDIGTLEIEYNAR